ncbi:MAG: hypothetical protein A2522_05725 [Gallionellales bacterium RIFOXYD12_FULL_53_10]|nr:MAG: hypothetical protein A2522_05725 [Gallionellales bacterium RIFOXYD12_FULL_53_10]
MIVAQLHLYQFAVNVVELPRLLRQCADFLPDQQALVIMSFKPCLNSCAAQDAHVFFEQTPAGFRQLIQAQGIG